MPGAFRVFGLLPGKRGRACPHCKNALAGAVRWEVAGRNERLLLAESHLMLFGTSPTLSTIRPRSLAFRFGIDGGETRTGLEASGSRLYTLAAISPSTRAHGLIDEPVRATCDMSTWNTAVTAGGAETTPCVTSPCVSASPCDGGIAIVDMSQRDPDKLIDQPVIIECEGEITAKVYRRDPERFEPYSDDPGFATIYPKAECKILGRIVDSVRRMPKSIR